MMISSATKQSQTWQGKFGDAYIFRNPQTLKEMEILHEKEYGETRSKMNQGFLNRLDLSLQILEVGCNVGHQLAFLREAGFMNLYGIEINQRAIKFARMRNFNVIQGTASDIPFKNQSFDLVFTSFLLVHIAPKNTAQVISEIYRCSRKYIWGLEYFAKEYMEVEYRGQKNLLWKTDFPKLYSSIFPDLILIQKRYLRFRPDLMGKKGEMMFLFEKGE